MLPTVSKKDVALLERVVNSYSEMDEFDFRLYVEAQELVTRLKQELT